MAPFSLFKMVDRDYCTNNWLSRTYGGDITKVSSVPTIYDEEPRQGTARCLIV